MKKKPILISVLFLLPFFAVSQILDIYMRDEKDDDSNSINISTYDRL